MYIDIDDIINEAWAHSPDSDVPCDSDIESVIDEHSENYEPINKRDRAKIMRDVNARLDEMRENDKELNVKHSAMEILSTCEEIYFFDHDELMEKIYNELEVQDMSRARAQELFDAIEEHVVNAITIYQGAYRERMSSRYGESWWLKKEEFDEQTDF